ncbi:MAG: aminoacyl-tRNA hydrolase [Deltaproteobacteria bacterium]|nr:aminoacyl-tRNA hydrolase [Deltaproteobacteria bacterium]
MAEATLVVGLGNPGPSYAENRHNFGFMVADALFARTGGGTWQEKFHGRFVRVAVGGRPVFLLKPMKYMNVSGRSLARAAGFFQIAADRIIVVHDELDLPFGTVRIKIGGGAGGHNGVESCIADLGDPGFVRVRMGIGRPPHGDATDFVLSDFSVDERPAMTEIIAHGADAVENVIGHGAKAAMNSFNKRS